jgi:hypothetical protein
LLDLLASAAEAMADGATIQMSGTSRDGSVFIEVREDGPDSAAEIRGPLFEPPPTAKNDTALGRRFGLLWRALIDFGGEIWAESSGPNTRFTVRLPRNAERRRAEPPVKAPLSLLPPELWHGRADRTFPQCRRSGGDLGGGTRESARGIGPQSGDGPGCAEIEWSA